MGIALQQREDSTAICLDGVVDIASATQLKTLLIDSLKSGKPVRISLESCAGVDVTTIQLLWAARVEANSQGVSFALTAPVPGPILAALNDVGFEDFPVPV